MSNKVWAVLFDGVCAVELYEDKGVALRRYDELAYQGEAPRLRQKAVHGGEVERWHCPGCCNVGTVPGKRVGTFGLPVPMLCPVCVKEGRIRQIGPKVYHVADGINFEAVQRVLAEWHREPKEPIDYSLAAGGDEDG